MSWAAQGGGFIVDRRNCDNVALNGVAVTLILRAAATSRVRAIYCGSCRHAAESTLRLHANYYYTLLTAHIDPNSCNYSTVSPCSIYSRGA